MGNHAKEVRSLPNGQFEVRKTSDGKRTVEGYLAVFGQRSVDLGGFTEVIARGAFSASLDKSPDVRLLVNHDWAKPLARVAAGTLSLREDALGLAFRASLPDTTYANDLCESMARGDVSGGSFGFTTDDDDWSQDQGGVVRTLRAVTLQEGSIVTNPAYPQTTVNLRSLPDVLRPIVEGKEAVRVAGDLFGDDAAAVTRLLLTRRKVYV